ncbi:hypothetical protein H072_7668 [Dactylellina haptotyla CBS 200.50]|uniref:Zn(2)-C6 fungal-type domain-containing protein n=1 Tax=Dactylellina haptotyla (strain CBS 200.50) TaxID=1284197 RepID=S8A692_DACHA|nr:hypothetical protein H072_7668 [Dactylellina haptotyla CBS 200.50]
MQSTNLANVERYPGEDPPANFEQDSDETVQKFHNPDICQDNTPLLRDDWQHIESSEYNNTGIESETNPSELEDESGLEPFFPYQYTNNHNFLPLADTVTPTCELFQDAYSRDLCEFADAEYGDTIKSTDTESRLDFSLDNFAVFDGVSNFSSDWSCNQSEEVMPQLETTIKDVLSVASNVVVAPNTIKPSPNDTEYHADSSSSATSTRKRKPGIESPLQGAKRRAICPGRTKRASEILTEHELPPEESSLRTNRRIFKRKGGLDPETRKNAAQVRKIGACLRCRRLNIRCDGSNPCKACIKVFETARTKISKEPCQRVNLKSLSLVRHSNGRFRQEKVAFLKYKWKDLDLPIVETELRWSLPGSTSVNLPLLKVSSREYQLEANDSTTTYHWQVEGKELMLQTKPLACVNDDDLKRDIKSFLEASQTEVQRWVMEQQSEPLILLTYKEAIRYRNVHKSDIIDLALKMQCGAVLSQGWGSFTGKPITESGVAASQNVGVCDYDKYNRFKDRPVTQAMGHQLDVAILQNILLDQERLLKLLEKMLFKPRKQDKPWYEIFLAYSVLLLNLEFIHGGARSYVISKLRTILESQVSYVVKSQIEEWEHSAGVMLYCFKYVLRGNLPLKAVKKNLEELVRRNTLDDEAIAYLQRVEETARRKGSESLGRTGNPPLETGRWLYQLFQTEPDPDEPS